MPKLGRLAVIRQYFPGSWKYLQQAQYWSGILDENRKDKRLMKLKRETNTDPSILSYYRVTWTVICGDITVVENDMERALQKMQKALYG